MRKTVGLCAIVLLTTVAGGCGSAPPADADGGHMKSDFLTEPSAGLADPASNLTGGATTDFDSGRFISGH